MVCNMPPVAAEPPDTEVLNGAPFMSGGWSDDSIAPGVAYFFAIFLMRFNLAVTLPAVLVGFGGHTNWRCKLLVSGGVTRGRVARGVMGGGATKGHDVPSASAENNPKRDQKRGPQQGGRPLSISED